jgi:hypothetical protein
MQHLSSDSHPITLTVHTLPSPDVSPSTAERTARGRWQMALVLLICALPVLASYFTYFVIRPTGRTNYSELIQPQRPLPSSLPLSQLDGRAVAPASLKGQWLLIVVSNSACNAACEKSLWLQRQLRESLGRDKDRLDKVWLITGGGAPAAKLLQAASAGTPPTILRTTQAALAAWLTPAVGQVLPDHIYIVDPMGDWMMRAPPEPDPAKLKRDVEKLMRGSAGWDKAGRSLRQSSQ